MYLENLGARIRELRKQMNISQEDFALSISMDRTYFSALESGKHNVTILNLKKIADGLHLTVSDLLKGVNE